MCIRRIVLCINTKCLVEFNIKILSFSSVWYILYLHRISEIGNVLYGWCHVSICYNIVVKTWGARIKYQFIFTQLRINHNVKSSISSAYESKDSQYKIYGKITITKKIGILFLLYLRTKSRFSEHLPYWPILRENSRFNL